MLATNEKRLRWWGIDLHARWRRRVAVVGTYFVMFVMTEIAMENRWPAHPYLDADGDGDCDDDLGGVECVQEERPGEKL